MTANQALDEFLNSVPSGQLAGVREKIKENTGVSSTVLYFWRKGRTKIKPIYRREINKIAGHDIFENVTD